MKERPYQPYHDHLVALARLNRKNPTPAEQKMWSQILRGKQLMGFKFLRQKPIKAIAIKHEMPSSSPDKGRLGGVS